jgi:hypothetical protein
MIDRKSEVTIVGFLFQQVDSRPTIHILLFEKKTICQVFKSRTISNFYCISESLDQSSSREIAWHLDSWHHLVSDTPLFLYTETSRATAIIAMAALKGNGTITLNKIKTITIMITDFVFILLYYIASIIN